MTKSINRDLILRLDSSLRSVFQLLAVGLALTGCVTVGPDYQPAELAAPEAWHSELQGGLAKGPSNPATLAHWWKVLQDPLLSNLEERAIKGNLLLKDARARISV